MTPIEKLILENQRMLLWENWRKYELIFHERGGGCRSVESNEIEEQVKKINNLLNPTKDKEDACDMSEEKNRE